MKKFIFIVISFLLLSGIYFSQNVYAQTKSDVASGFYFCVEWQEKGLTPEKAETAISNIEKQLKTLPLPQNSDQLLYQLAKYKTYIGCHPVLKEDGSYDKQYFEKRAQEYDFNPFGAFYAYRGRELETLIKKYPKSPLADEAAYMLATLIINGETEGIFPFAFSVYFSKYKPFMIQFPDSPYIDNVLQKTNDMLALSENTGLYNYVINPNSNEDIQERKQLINNLNDCYGILIRSKNPKRVETLYLLAQAYSRIKLNNKAKEVYGYILKNFPRYSKYKQVQTEYKKLSWVK